MKTSRALAYLKSTVPADDPSPAIQLSQSDSPVLKGLENGLVVSYVVDEGDSFSYIQHRDLASDQIGEDELHTIGIRNLFTMVERGELRVVPYGEIFAVLFGGNFEASVILLDALWKDSFREFVPGDYLVAIPSRDVLAFCNRSSKRGREQLHEVVDRTTDSKYALLKDLLTWKDDRWVIEETAQ